MSAISRATAADALAQRYRAVRAATLALAEPLSAEDCALQSMPDASPTKWHLAHTSWYFETFALEPALPGYRRSIPRSGCCSTRTTTESDRSIARPQRGLLTRPSLAEVHAYREHVDRRCSRCCEGESSTPRCARWSARHAPRAAAPGADPHRPEAPACAESARAGVPRVRRRTRARATGATPRFVALPGGVREVGYAGAGFAFDNEGPRHRVYLEPFALASRPSPTASISRSSKRAATASGAWLADGWGCGAAQGWERRCTGSCAAARGGRSRSAACASSRSTSR
jgi:hypothetical protein